jgi:hypothetical protein
MVFIVTYLAYRICGIILTSKNVKLFRDSFSPFCVCNHGTKKALPVSRPEGLFFLGHFGLVEGFFFWKVRCSDFRFSPSCYNDFPPRVTSSERYYFYQCCGSVTYWPGSGSVDLCLWLMDPDPTTIVIDLQDANKKTIFKFFCLLLSWGAFTSFFKD